MLNHILCSLTKEEVNLNKSLEYIRILGFSKNGQNHLTNIKKDIKIPILNKYDTNKYKTLFCYFVKHRKCFIVWNILQLQ